MSKAAYDGIADWYDESLASGSIASFHQLAISAVLDLTGTVANRTVCDLACGQGIVARRLADFGADVVGIDISPELLEIAQSYESYCPTGISYVCDDAEELGSVSEESFDVVVCNLALMDIPDAEKVLRTVHRVLRSGGRFVFSIVHPCFLTPGSPRWIRERDRIVGMDVREYFEEGFWSKDNANEAIRGRVGSHHRTLGSYMNMVSRSGLVVRHVIEPRATGAIADALPGYKEVPGILALRCEKID